MRIAENLFERKGILRRYIYNKFDWESVEKKIFVLTPETRLHSIYQWFSVESFEDYHHFFFYLKYHEHSFN